MTITTISPKLLHKNSIDDVLLSHPRKVIPVGFTSTASNDHLSDDIGAINQLYRPDNRQGYVLRFPSDHASAKGQRFPSTMLEADSESGRAVPHQILAEICQHESMEVPSRAFINDDSIESFLNYHGITSRSTSFSMVNRADHYFFYRKPHEHVPGIMLIEAARQALYYQLYTYSGHDLGKVTASLSELNAQFYAYCELMHPIEIIVDDLTLGDDRFPREIHYSVSFYQRGILVAQINSLAPVIPLGRFKMARNACLFDNERFSPLSNAPIISLITSADMAPLNVSLREIGRDRCVTSAAEHSGLSNAFLTIIYDGNLHFHAPIIAVSADVDSVSWDFGDVEYNQAEQLKEMIKRGFVACDVDAQQGAYHDVSY